MGILLDYVIVAVEGGVLHRWGELASVCSAGVMELLDGVIGCFELTRIFMCEPVDDVFGPALIEDPPCVAVLCYAARFYGWELTT